MKKFLFIMFVMGIFLYSCAVDQTATATQPPAGTVFATPDAGMSTPATGFATVKKLTNMKALLLRSKPDGSSPLSGQVSPGDTGQLIGLDKTGSWALLVFKEQSGWAPVEALELTIAQ